MMETGFTFGLGLILAVTMIYGAAALLFILGLLAYVAVRKLWNLFTNY